MSPDTFWRNVLCTFDLGPQSLKEKMGSFELAITEGSMKALTGQGLSYVLTPRTRMYYLPNLNEQRMGKR